MKWPFGRRKKDAIDILSDAEWTCGSCKEPHRGMFALGYLHPLSWRGEPDYEPNSELDLTRDFLSEDFCVIAGEHFLVRCSLEIPVNGLEDKFSFGCWGSLKKENFETYLDHFDTGTCPDGAPWWSWLANRLEPITDDESVGCWMFPQNGRLRPVLRVDDESHPLALAQRDGLSPEHVLTIYAHYGHGPLA